jgi:hypothetical protein
MLGGAFTFLVIGSSQFGLVGKASREAATSRNEIKKRVFPSVSSHCGYEHSQNPSGD